MTESLFRKYKVKRPIIATNSNTREVVVIPAGAFVSAIGKEVVDLANDILQCFCKRILYTVYGRDLQDHTEQVDMSNMEATNKKYRVSRTIMADEDGRATRISAGLVLVSKSGGGFVIEGSSPMIHVSILKSDLDDHCEEVLDKELIVATKREVREGAYRRKLAAQWAAPGLNSSFEITLHDEFVSMIEELEAVRIARPQ